MFEFNPDGSIKLPQKMAQKEADDENRMKNRRAIRLYRDLVSMTAPKKCMLRITLSNMISDERFMETIHTQWNERASVPSNIRKVGEKEFEIEIGTDFRRCSDCTRLIGEYRQFLDGNLIEKKGSCGFKGMDFSYEDHFE